MPIMPPDTPKVKEDITMDSITARNARATGYIRKCRRRRLRALQRRERDRERNINLAASIIGCGGGAMALIMVGVMIGGQM